MYFNGVALSSYNLHGVLSDRCDDVMHMRNDVFCKLTVVTEFNIVTVTVTILHCDQQSSNYLRFLWTGLDNAYNFTDCIAEPRSIAAFFQRGLRGIKARKGEDSSQASETVELSGGSPSQDEISNRHGHAVAVDISVEDIVGCLDCLLVQSDPTETTADSENDDDDLDVLGPQVDESDTEPFAGSVQGQNHHPTRSVPGPNDLSQTFNDGPTQVYMRKYPTHVIGNVSRRFNSKWYNNYSWLEYSTMTDSVYCFCCRHFGTDTEIAALRGQDVFTHTGFRAWNRCAGSDPKTNSLILHKNSDEHQFAVERMESYRAMDTAGKTVVDMLDSEHRKQVTIILCFKQYNRQEHVLLYDVSQSMIYELHKYL
jgi:hypothetical protein